MNKEEVLAKSREDNKNEDEREKQVRMRASIASFIGMGVVGITLMVLEMFLLDTVILSRCIYLVIIGSLTTQNLYLALTLKKKGYLFAAAGFVFCLILAVLQVITAFQTMM